MGAIFNESFAEKKKVCMSREQCTEPTQNIKCQRKRRRWRILTISQNNPIHKLRDYLSHNFLNIFSK